MALIDSAATSSFIQSAQGLQITGKSNKVVRAANGGLMQASSTALLDLIKLRNQAREAIVVPGLNTKALLSVSPLANAGYTTIFHPHKQGVTVHDKDSFKLTFNEPPVLQGCRNEAGLWTVPISDAATISQSLDIDEAAMNVYDLPSTKEVVRFFACIVRISDRTNVTYGSSQRKPCHISRPHSREHHQALSRV